MKLIKQVELAVDVTEEYKNNVTDNVRVDEWELEAAKRTAFNLRSLLFEEKMLELLNEQLDESDERIKNYAAQAPDDFNYGRLTLTVKGMYSQELFSFIANMMASTKESSEQVKEVMFKQIFVAHPEHYALGDGNIETMGGLPTVTLPVMTKIEEAPDFVKEFVDDTYAVKAAGAGPLRDGTPFTYVLQQFRDTSEGMVADLMIWYPAGCPDIYVEEHLEHYAIEFRNGCRVAAQQKK